MAGELRRLAGAAPGPAVETVALVADLSSLACTGARPVAADRWPSTSRDRRPHCSWPTGPRAGSLAEAALPPVHAGVDLTRPATALDPPSAGDDRRAGRPADHERMDLTRWTALGLSLACADLVGTMEGAVQLATAYASARRQYGAAIGSFQAVQHLLADAYVQTEGARSVTLHAAWAVDELAPADALAAAAVAKAYCARAARQVCETAIQVHGGIGNTWECLAHLYLRRALLSDRPPRRRRGQPGAGARPPRHRERRWTSVTRRPNPSSGSGCGTGWRTTTPACPRPRPTTTTGPAPRPGTIRSTTPASSACPGPRRSAARVCRASTR